MKIGDKVRATKVAGKANATLPNGHEVVGQLSLMEEGAPLAVYGPDDNVVTTAIELLTFEGDKKAYAHTRNSLWRIEAVE